MIERCHNENHISFKYYGAKGISVAPEWRHDYMAFYAHVGPRPTEEHSLDRIRPTGNYEPGNVRWSTEKQQQRNRSSNKLTIHDARLIRHWFAHGYKQADIARAFGVTATLVCRIRKNQTWVEE